MLRLVNAYLLDVIRYPYQYYLEAYNRKLCRAEISKGELHILLTAFWATIYEPFIHGYPMEQIEAHSRRVCRLFNWFSALDFTEEAIRSAVLIG